MSETDGKTREDQSGSEKHVETTNESEEPAEKIWKNEWMLRPCDMYYSEYKVCDSLRGKFHQIFVHGETIDCSQWKIDYNNCTKWKKSDDEQAYEDLMTSEKGRRLERLRPHYANDVWTKRAAPPSDWNAPLPDWLVKREAKTFLAGKQAEINTTGDRERELYLPSCTIL